MKRVSNPIKLKRFSNPIKDNSICLLIGPRGSGKTTAISNLMFQKKDIPMVIIMSPTEPFDKSYADEVPQGIIFDHFSGSALEAIIARQRAIVSGDFQKKRSDLEHTESADSKVCVIVDGCFEGNISKSELVRNWFANTTHLKMLSIVSMQYCIFLSDELRTKVDYVFCFKTYSRREKENLHQLFFIDLINFDTFVQVFDQITEDYTALVLDETIRSSVFEEKVFFWEPRLTANLRMDDAIWQHSQSSNVFESKEQIDGKLSMDEMRKDQTLQQA